MLVNFNVFIVLFVVVCMIAYIAQSYANFAVFTTLAMK